jgi:hypothetical protein
VRELESEKRAISLDVEATDEMMPKMTKMQMSDG